MEIASPTSREAAVHQVGNRLERILVIDAQICPLGQELAQYQLMFSQLPHCQGLCGSQKYARRRAGGRHRLPVFSLKEDQHCIEPPALQLANSRRLGTYCKVGR